MENKKSKNANLERKRGVFFSLGMVICSSVVLMAFTYSTADYKGAAVAKEEHDLVTEFVYDIPEETEVQEEQPQDVTPPVIIEDIVIVDDDDDYDDFDFVDIDDIDDIPDDPITDEIKEEPPVDFAEIEPSFPGGEGAMMMFIQRNVVYPELSVEMGEEGIVYVQFVVNKDGSIEQVDIARGISERLDKEAVKVVKKMPKWTPGEQAGKKVRCRFTLPIKFTTIN